MFHGLKAPAIFQMSWVDELDQIGVMDDSGSQRLNHSDRNWQLGVCKPLKACRL